MAALVVVGTAPASAGASQVSVSGQTITLVDSVAAANFVTINWGISGDFPPSITDNAGVTPVAPCEERVVGIVCPVAGKPTYVTRLGGGDDVGRVINSAAAGTRSTLLGEDGADDLTSGDGSDILDGGSGNDELTPDQDGSAPGDIARGGSGVDELQAASTLAPRVAISLDDRANDGGPGEADNYASDIENVTGSAVAQNTIVGSAKDNVLNGRDLSDSIRGGGGRDTLDGLSGSDTLNALDGRGGDRVDCGDGADAAYADSGDIVASGCERVILAPASSSRLGVRSGRIRLPLRCPRSAPGTCAGKLRLTARGKTLATGSYRVRRGRTSTVKLRPRRRLARTTRAALTVAPRGAGAASARAVTIRR